MNCSQCGSEIVSNAKFCSSCGSNQTELSENNTASTNTGKKQLLINLATWAVILSLPAYFILPGIFSSEPTSKYTPPSALLTQEEVQESLNSQLLDEARSLAANPSYGVTSPSLCDKVYDLQFKQVSYGTLKANNIGKTRFPGMIANLDYMCVNPITGDRNRRTDLWVILANDEIGGMLRCAKIAGRRFIEGLMEECDFQPEASESVAVM